jgi:hypothetical protein
MIKIYGKNMVCQYLKLGIKYKIYKNAVLCMMIELDRGCAHLIFPSSVLYGCVAVFFLSMLIGHLVAYGGFKKTISGYTRNRMQNPTIKLT